MKQDRKPKSVVRWCRICRRNLTVEASEKGWRSWRNHTQQCRKRRGVKIEPFLGEH